MIKCLQIKNYAIIEALQIDFSEGLTIITGETGAGKSILMGALGLIMGKRADTKALYDLSKKCIVEAFFDVKRYPLKAFFEENDIDYEEELVIRREITPSGKSRAFVNDTPVNLKILQEISSTLVDLHQQFDTLDIHQVSFQLRMLDALADNQSRLTKYGEGYKQYQSNKRKLAELRQLNEQSGREIEFIQFQLKEFNEVELLEGEQAKLEEELNRLSNAEDIKRTASGLFQSLSEHDPSIIGQLEELGVNLGNLKDFDPQLAQLHQRFTGLIFELQDLAAEFEKVAEDTEYDGERILEIQQRLDSIYRLQNKHQVSTVKDLLQIQKELQQRLNTFSDLGTEIRALEKKIEKEEEQLLERALKLRKHRQSIISGFEKKIASMLAQLAMEHAQLEVDMVPLEELGPTGLDEVNFLFSANKGGRMQMIKDVASGGELSRLTLVTKSLVASAIPLPTLIFDEIDTGISGDVALKMGNILRQLSDHHQVVSITHSPQVASKANVHYFVYKKIKNERTVTKVRSLSTDERVRAIATMLSQNPPSESAIENAKELLSLSG